MAGAAFEDVDTARVVMAGVDVQKTDYQIRIVRVDLSSRRLVAALSQDL